MAAAVLAPERRLMCVLAHPDDESLGTGGTLARYAAEGVGTYLLTATRGEHGRFHEGQVRPGPEVVGRTREDELLAAAKELGVREVSLLGYPDGGLDRVEPAAAIERIVSHIRRVRPQVVITFAPDGAYGHPDHIAISQLATAATVCAADGSFGDIAAVGEPHRVAKLYFIAWSETKWNAYQAALKNLTVTVDGHERQAVPWPRWAITSVIDTSRVWQQVWRAVSCHKTQMGVFSKLHDLPDEHQRALWGTQEFYRAFSIVNCGRAQESDLFEGLS
jgi:LmbE family N-acetylglucosaminyl deacetylase